jgi:hypothetical protein
VIFEDFPREEKFNQDHLQTIIASEVFTQNANPKRMMSHNQLVVHMDKSICHHGNKVQENFI